jgi:hypothetical protein
VRSALVILYLPVLNLGRGFGNCREPMHVQTFVTKRAVEGFNVRIVCWFPRPRKGQLDLVVIRSQINESTSELAAIVAVNSLRRLSSL